MVRRAKRVRARAGTSRRLGDMTPLAEERQRHRNNESEEDEEVQRGDERESRKKMRSERDARLPRCNHERDGDVEHAAERGERGAR